MNNAILTAALVASALMGGIVGGNVVAHNRAPETKFVPSYIYADLAEAREAATHYSCTDIIGVPDGYRLEVLPNETCVAHAAITKKARTMVCTDRSGNVFINPTEAECQDFKEIRWL